MAVKVVTDSTCDLSGDVAQGRGITVIPCNVHFGDQAYKDGIDLGPDEFYRRLASTPALPTTAQPSVNDFLEVYRPLIAQGDDVVSVHLSAKFSGTLNSAYQAREATGADAGRIRIVDSRMTSSGLGVLVMEAASLAGEGASLDQVVEEVEGALERTHCYFILDTLQYLQKGGRIGKASAFVGTLLNIKPILTIKDGEAHPLERVRTRERGVRRLGEIIRELAPVRRLCVTHSTTPEEAQALKEGLAGLAPEGEEVLMCRFGPVVGTYLGPGALGVGLLRAS